MKKWIIVGCALVIGILVVLIVGISNLGPIIKKAVNSYGPEITKTEVRVKDVELSLFSGQAELKDFYLGNPKGFKSPHAVKVASVYVDVDEGSLTGETVVIDKIEIVRPEITYEKTQTTDNFQAILANVQGAERGGGPSEKGSEKETGKKKLLIRDLVVTDGRVNLALSMVAEKRVSASMPDIHLTDLGKGGASTARVFEEVLAALSDNITSRTVMDSLHQELKALGLEMDTAGERVQKEVDSMRKELKNELEGVTDQAKGLFGK